MQVSVPQPHRQNQSLCSEGQERCFSQAPWWIWRHSGSTFLGPTMQNAELSLLAPGPGPECSQIHGGRGDNTVAAGMGSADKASPSNI